MTEKNQTLSKDKLAEFKETQKRCHEETRNALLKYITTKDIS